jgi:hypothetical protein
MRSAHPREGEREYMENGHEKAQGGWTGRRRKKNRDRRERVSEPIS